MKISLFGCIALAMMLLLPAPQPATAQSSSGQSTGVTRQDDRVGQIFSDLEKRIIREVLEGTGAVDADKEVDKILMTTRAKATKPPRVPARGRRAACRRGWRSATGSRLGSRSSWSGTEACRRAWIVVRFRPISKIACRTARTPNGSLSAAM